MVFPKGVFYVDFCGDRNTIVSLRKEKGLTQEQLALECEISVSYLRRIEHGQANPTIHALWRLAEVLEVELQNRWPAQ